MNPSLLREDLWAHDIPLLFWVLYQGCRSQPDHFFSTKLCDLSLQSWLYRSLSAVSRLFSARIAPHIVVFLMCLWGDVSSAASFTAILIPPLYFQFLRYWSFFTFLNLPRFGILGLLHILSHLPQNVLLFLKDIPLSTSRILFIYYHLRKSWSSYQCRVALPQNVHSFISSFVSFLPLITTYSFWIFSHLYLFMLL